MDSGHCGAGFMHLIPSCMPHLEVSVVEVISHHSIGVVRNARGTACRERVPNGGTLPSLKRSSLQATVVCDYGVL